MIVGEAFPVQYILEDLETAEGFTPPPFTGFRVVRGPDVFRGSRETASGKKFIRTIFYTLVANRTGKYLIRGATAVVDGREIRSDDVQLEVVNAVPDKAPKVDPNSGYFLQPGEDPYQKLRDNLFMKVQVDRRDCYIGQPVVATFKLYSRLQSKSDIVKNPGFYGFTVQDMIGLNDHVAVSEVIDGKKFDVHTVRTVQLYPLQAGTFTIDPMEVSNKVEFSRSVVNKNVEQVIVEGVFEDHGGAQKQDGNTLVVENNISTEPIRINVRAYPAKNKPEGFNGATGKFLIHATLGKDSLGNNEQGQLLLTIEGNGNFPQLTPPSIQWPDGIEGFDPAIVDTLDKSHSPLRGKRVFQFPFVASKKGKYLLNPISFSYFDTDSNTYKTITTEPLQLTIVDSATIALKEGAAPSNAAERGLAMWWALGGLMIAILGFLAFYRRRRKMQKIQAIVADAPALRVAADYLQPAAIALKINAPQFYSALQKGIWEFLGARLQLSGSRMNKRDLRTALLSGNFSDADANEILDILADCEKAAFTTAEFNNDRQALLNRAERALQPH